MGYRTFSRGELPHFAGINTFLKAPYLEDVHRCGEYDVAVLGVPFDGGTTYRSGTRFGPQGIRKISALYVPYSFESVTRPPAPSPNTWAAASSASSTSTATSTPRRLTSTSGCTPPRGFTPRTSPTCRRRTWYRSAPTPSGSLAQLSTTGPDADDLRSIGYQQQLHRRLGWFSSFAAGFSFGGPAFFWTWPLVFAGQLCVALVFAELAAS